VRRSGAGPAGIAVVMMKTHIGGDVAQLGEHLVRNEGVGGSNPLISTKLFAVLFDGSLGAMPHPVLGRSSLSADAIPMQRACGCRNDLSDSPAVRHTMMKPRSRSLPGRGLYLTSLANSTNPQFDGVGALSMPSCGGRRPQ
jgi:hypothetical protein